MPVLERDQVFADDWTQVADDADLPAGPALISLARFRENPGAFAGHNAKLGIVVDAKAAGTDLADVAAAAELIVVQFDKFRDGRGFSIARQLRERHGFAGKLRARGHVLPDQHVFLLRCGFDGVTLPDDADLAPWRAALTRFPTAYQPAVLAESPGERLGRVKPGAVAVP